MKEIELHLPAQTLESVTEESIAHMGYYVRVLAGNNSDDGGLIITVHATAALARHGLARFARQAHLLDTLLSLLSRAAHIGGCKFAVSPSEDKTAYSILLSYFPFTTSLHVPEPNVL